MARRMLGHRKSKNEIKKEKRFLDKED